MIYMTSESKSLISIH